MPKKKYSGEEALPALLQGREEGLDHFFKLYYSPLTYFAFKLLSDQFLAEEIASEAFVKLWNHRYSLARESSVKAWLYTTVRNESINHLRKVKRLQNKKEGVVLSNQLTETTILHRMIETETIHRIIHSIEILPPRCSRIFQMFYLQGKSHEEIAKELNLSPNTVRVQKARAIKILKTRINYLLFLAFLFC